MLALICNFTTATFGRGDGLIAISKIIRPVGARLVQLDCGHSPTENVRDSPGRNDSSESEEVANDTDKFNASKTTMELIVRTGIYSNP